MKDSRKYPHRNVRYSSECFNDEVAESLIEHGFFVLTDVPDSVFQALDALTKLSTELFQRHREGQAHGLSGNKSNFAGFFDVQDYVAGTNNADRIFINFDSVNSVREEDAELLAADQRLQQFATCLLQETSEIVKRIGDALELRFEVEPGELTRKILGPAMLSLTQYRLLTQKRLRQIVDSNRFMQTPENEFLQFHPHPDVTPLNILYEPFGTNGLQFLLKNSDLKSYATLDLSELTEPFLIILAGKQLKELLAGNVRAPKHRVISTPQIEHQQSQVHPVKRRFVLSLHQRLNAKMLEPVLSEKTQKPIQPLNKQRKHPFLKSVSEAESFKLLVRQNETSCNNTPTEPLQDEYIQQFPVSGQIG